jgi:hypothetical protein
VHGAVFSSLYEHHINKLSPTAMDWISFGASRKFLRDLSGPISVTMNTVSSPVLRKRTCVLSTTAAAAELANITNIQQTWNLQLTINNLHIPTIRGRAFVSKPSRRILENKTGSQKATHPMLRILKVCVRFIFSIKELSILRAHWHWRGL